MITVKCRMCPRESELSLDASTRWECTGCRCVNFYVSPSIRYIEVSDAAKAGEKVG